MPKHKPVVLTVDDAAAILCVTPRRVRALIKAGKLKARKFDKRSWLILPAAVEACKRRREQSIQPWTSVVRRGRTPALPKVGR